MGYRILIPRLVWWSLAGCGPSPGGAAHQVSLEGLWVANTDELPTEVVRPGYTRPILSQVVRRGWRITRDADTLRWCRRDVRDGEDPMAALQPCDCAGAQVEDCASGRMRIHDTLADRVVADVTLQHDDARADWVGTLVLMPSTTGEVLGMNVVSLLQDPTRHPEAADGMAGPLWTGADGLGWYRRVEQASD